MLHAIPKTPLHARLVARTHHQLRSGCLQWIEEAVGRLAHRNRDRTGEASLARISKGGVQNRRDGDLGVGVRHNDDVVLGATERLHALAAGCRRLVDVAGDGSRPDK